MKLPKPKINNQTKGVIKSTIAEGIIVEMRWVG